MDAAKVIVFTLGLLMSPLTFAQYVGADLVTLGAEKAGVDKRVFYSLLVVESGKSGKPWLWTLGTREKSYFFKTKDEASQKLKEIIKTNSLVDVGPAQVNWYYHSDKVGKNIDKLLEPKTNILLGAEVLRYCLKRYKKIRNSLSCYNAGRVTKLGLSHADKVLKVAKKLGFNPAGEDSIKSLLIAASRKKPKSMNKDKTWGVSAL